MKNFAMIAILSTATAAILAAIGNAVWAGSKSEERKHDDLNETLANYYSRREFLRNYRPLAGELAKGREVMCQFIEKMKAKGDTDAVERLEKILSMIDEDFAKTENLRNECLANEYVFDEDGFELNQNLSESDYEKLERDLKEATRRVEGCIRKLESDATWWRREYTLAKIGLKVCAE